MVYESDFYTTRRTYSRPSVSSYTVSYPIYSYTPVVRRVYTTSYPIYSRYNIPFVAHKRLVTGTRILTSPIRTTRSVYSPIRTSYVRTTRTYSPIRVIESPVRELSPITTYSYTTPITTSTPSFRTLPTTLLREYQRIDNKYRPNYYSKRVLDDYLNSNSYIHFDDETRRIRTSAATLLREIHTPVFRRARSVTPFPVSRTFQNYQLKEKKRAEPEPVSSMVLNSYISRVTNPLRPYVNDPSINLDPITRRYIAGKSHLASVRYVGGKAYNIRNPLYDVDRVRTDVEYLSRYLRDRRAVSEKIADRKIALESVTEASEVAASG